ncbi:MAG: hypothetical protein HOG71_10775 [Bacteroidetes bacterium]|nr:hypothetical protein [Bacteroidota bacterium]
MKKLFFVLLLSVFTFQSFSQLETKIGAEVGLQAYFYTLYDEGDLLWNPPIPGAMFSFKIAQEIKKSFEIETGFSRFTYYGGPNTRDGYFHIMASNTLICYQIPFRFKYTFPLIKDKLFFTPHIGFSFNINDDFLSESSGTTIRNSPLDTLKITHQDLTGFRKLFFMQETGLSLKLKLKSDVRLTSSINYQSGFFKLIETNIVYSTNSGPEKQASLISNGNNLKLLFGLEYPLSNIWQKSSYRKETKNERIKSVKESNNKRFYIGFGAGALWRYYSSIPSKDVITSRNGRYAFPSFNYADFTIGINFGVKLHENIGLQTGISTQNFWNRYYIMDEDDVIYGGGTRFGESNLFKIPLLFEYHYQLPSVLNRFTIIPSLGMNLLHSRITGDYESFSGNVVIYNLAYPNDSLYREITFARPNKNIITLTTGIEIDFYILKNLILYLKGEYTLGTGSVLNQIDTWVFYQNKGYSAIQQFRGKSSELMMGFKVPFDFKKQQ